MVDQVEITWPDGSIEIFTSVEANQVIHIKENIDKKIINEITEKTISSVDIFPNPFTDMLIVEFNKVDFSFFELKISDSSGREVFNKSIKKGGKTNFELHFNDDANLSPGVYFYTLITDNTFNTGKIIQR